MRLVDLIWEKKDVHGEQKHNVKPWLKNVVHENLFIGKIMQQSLLELEI